MALTDQQIDLIFTEGVDTKTDDKIATKLSVLENANVGQKLTVNKRFGFDELDKKIVNAAAYGEVSPIIEGEVLFTHKDKLGILNKDIVAVYSDQNTDKWFLPGEQAMNVEISIESIDLPHVAGTSRGLQAVEGPNDILIVGNYISLAGEFKSSAIRKNKNDGTIIPINRIESSTEKTDSSRLARIDDKVYVISKDSTTNQIYAYDATAYSSSTPTLPMISDAHATCVFEVFVENGKLLVIYTELAGKLKVVAFDSALTVLNTFVHTTETRTIIGGASITWSATLSGYALFYYSFGTPNFYFNAITLNSSLVLSGSITSENRGSLFDATIPPHVTSSLNMENGNVKAYFESKITGADFRLNGNEYNGTLFTSIGGLNGTRLVARSFLLNNKINIPIRLTTGASERAILVDDAFSPICSLSIDLESVDMMGLGIYSSSVGIPLGVSQYGSSLINLKTSTFSGSSPKEIHDSTFFSNGGGFAFDGATFSECGFLAPPVYIGIAASVGAGNVPTGTHSYALTFSFVDFSGNVYESAPVVTDEIVLATPKSVNVSLGIIPSRRSDDVNFARLYRRDDGIYKLVSEKSFAEVIATGVITDNRTSVVDQPTLYTTGGVLENDPPPPMNVFTTHGDRVFGINEERPVEIYFTKKFQQGEGIHFSSFLYFSANDNKNKNYERCVALGSLDDKLAILKNQSLYAVFGDGPNALGVGAFSEPRLISTDVGCRDARSVVNTSEGLMFMSSKGFYLLSRSLEVSYIGADVEAFNNEEITSAVLLPKTNQVKFTTRNGVMLVYSYLTAQWSWATNYNAQGAVLWKNALTHLKVNGSVRKESSSFLDIATPITQKIGTSWIKLNGIQGMQRIKRLMLVGDFKSTHKVLVKIYYDFEQYAWEEKTIIPRPSGYNTTVKPDINTIYTGANDGVYQFEIQLSRQKCQAIKVEISDFDHTGESFTLTGMSLLVGIKKGLNKLTNNKQF